MAGLALHPGGPQTVCRRLTLTGIVQGVGFRPLVYRLASAYGLEGWVRNSSRGLTIVVQGPPWAVKTFQDALTASPPPLARIDQLAVEELPPGDYAGFSIEGSAEEGEARAVIPPDAALCPDCRREVLDPHDRRYLYPFANCTNCGPRFTITHGLPYDRHQTTMDAFPLCPDCAAEYQNPGDRRFHAQPVACPRCGPQVRLVDGSGFVLAEEDWPVAAADLLRRGKILAVKSLGGFHLACMAQGQTIERLRRLKGRPAKPLAVMARDLETVQRYLSVSPAAEKLLTSPAAPIVILPLKEGAGLSPELAPGLSTLGVMLPYTPLHLVLFAVGSFELLVMTSGNPSGLPLATENSRALAQLNRVADAFLIHNREIANACDDSVVAVTSGGVQFRRRSRGYVPRPVEVPWAGQPPVLGVGADLKNTFCLIKDGRAYLSQHIGDLEYLEVQNAFRENLDGWRKLLRVEPTLAACDPHPGYESSRLAQNLGLPLFQVQHHHAHLASCLAENGSEGPALGLILDGTGAGEDGRAWGFELLAGDFTHYRRLAHLQYVPLPGGDLAVRKPWRTAVAYLSTFLGSEGEALALKLFGAYGPELEAVLLQLRRRLNTPEACGAGRLFDAVAAVCGLAAENTYDGQAAIELGELAAKNDKLAEGSYHLPLLGDTWDPRPLWYELALDLTAGVSPGFIGVRFHRAVAKAVVEGAQTAREATGLNVVALAGGVWQNTLLLETVRKDLTDLAFQVLLPRQAPPNDGGLALGQAMIAAWRWKQDVSGGTHAGA